METTTLFALGFVLLFLAVIIITFVEKKYGDKRSAYIDVLENRLNEARQGAANMYEDSIQLAKKLGRAEKKIESMKRDHKLQLQRLSDPANRPEYDQSKF